MNLNMFSDIINPIQLKIALVTLIIILTGNNKALCQQTIKFIIADFNNKAPIVNTTVVLSNFQDTTDKQQALSNGKGIIQFKERIYKRIKFKITCVGYYSSEVMFYPETIYQTHDTIFLKPHFTQLKEVVIKGTQPPMRLKNDTLEYNADSYKVRAGSKVEDLLKKLPGISVDRESEVVGKGKVVQSILVNGQKFFGDDLKYAIQNIPTALIAKIQLYDSKTDEIKYGKLDDGTRISTINIVTKEPERKTYFGNLIMGVGIKNLHNLSGNVNTLGRGINYNLFGQLDNASLTGSGNNKFPSSNKKGTTEKKITGLNFSYIKSSIFKVNGSIQYSSLLDQLSQSKNTINFLPSNGIQKNESLITSKNHSSGVLFNINLEGKIDSTTSITITSNINKQIDQQIKITGTSIYSNTLLQSRSITNLLSTPSTFNQTFSAFLNKRFTKPGRFVSLSLSSNSNNLKQVDSIQLQSVFNSKSLVQQTNSFVNQSSYGISINYSEPIQKSGSLLTSYNYSYAPVKNRRETSDYDSINRYYIVNDSVSNTTKSRLTYHQFGFSYQYSHNFFSASIGSGIQLQEITYSNNIANNTTSNYLNLYPNLTVTYKLSDKRTTVLNYRGAINPPGAELLQPIIDNRDPLNIRLGNPQLRPTFTHSLDLSYSSLSDKYLPFLVSFNTLIITNQITDALTVASNGSQISRPINFNGNYALSLNIDKTYILSKIDLSVSLNTRMSYRQIQSSVNGLENFNRTKTLGENISLSKTINDHFDLSINLQPSIFINSNTVNKEVTRYFNNRLLLDISWYNDNWTITTYSTNTYYGKYAGNKTNWVNILNLFFERKLLKTHPLSASISIFNLLNEHTNVLRIAYLNTFQEMINSTVKPYILFGIKYELRH